MKKQILLLLLLALASVAYSASTNATGGGGAVYISTYSTIPETLYPGSSGQLKITLTNPGSETAKSVTIAGPGGVSVWVGDMGAGSSTITSIPFTVPEKTTGLHLIYLTIYYSDSGGTQASQLTIPLQISQEKILTATTLSVDKQVIFPGDIFTVQIEVKNTGGVANNVILSSPSSSFLIAGNYINIGSIPYNSSKNVSITLQTTSSTPSGRQMIPILLSYEDALRNVMNDTIYLGPIVVEQPHSQLRVEMLPVGTVEIGSQAEFTLRVRNMGSTSESAVVEVVPTSVFTPIGSSKIYFDQIEAGANKTRTVFLGVAPSTAAGYYELSLNVTSGSGYSSIEKVGVYVQATPELTITTETTAIPIGAETKIQIKIANTGNSAIRSVYVTASSKDLQVTSDTQFVGTLNVDDYFTYQPTISAPARLTQGKYKLEVVVTFRDGTNQQRSIRKELEIQVGGSALPTAASFANRTRSAGGFRVFGIDVIPILEVLVVLVVLYFAAPRIYRKYKEYREGRKR
ncbi:MAG: hypothetical protein QXF56_02290 [Candidatus Micrarchaeia archaeon]